MRMPGRFWWRWMFEACVVAVAGGWFVVSELARQVWVDWSTKRPLGSDWQLPALAAAEVAVFAAYLVGKALHERSRYVRRKAALRGAQDAMPRADVVIPQTGLPDVSAAPLAVVRPAPPPSSTSPRRRMLSIAAQSGVAVLATGAVVVWLINFTGQSERAHGLPTTTAMLWPGMLPMIVLAGLAPIVLGVVAAWSAKAQNSSLVATGDGIERRGPGRRTASIPWGELRLLEITADDKSAFPARRYRLYGDRGIIEWVGERGGLGPMFGASQAAAYSQRELDLLMGVIHARTGLVPRTFVKRWQVRAPSSTARRQRRPATSARRSQGIGAVAAILVVALASAGLAGAVLLVPLTAPAALNGAIATSLGVFTAFCLFGAVSEARARLTSAQRPLTTPMREQPREYGTVYGLSLEPTRPARAVAGLLGAVLLIDLIPGALWLLTALAKPLGLPHLVTAGTAATILAFVLLLYGLFGMAAISIALHGSGRTIRADDRGLSIALGQGAIVRTVQWDSIEDVCAQVRRGDIIGYLIRDASGRSPVFLPDRVSWQQGVRPVSGTQPISPAEMAALAALAAQRSGRAAHGEGTSE